LVKNIIMTDPNNVLRAGISPCPNDTYIFGAWVLGLVDDVPGFRTRFEWEDVQTLNEAAGKSGLTLIKVSAATAVRLGGDFVILESGGAFGLEHGPKLVVQSEFKGAPGRIAVPGMDTSAYALLRAAIKNDFLPVPMRFDYIPAAVKQGEVDAGLLIHESALVYASQGLKLYLDLGGWWSEISGGLPIPLGCIVARRGESRPAPDEINSAIIRSIDYARHKPHDIWPLIASLARETGEDVLSRHIQAYVNEFSREMGSMGRQALDLLRDVCPHPDKAGMNIFSVPG